MANIQCDIPGHHHNTPGFCVYCGGSLNVVPEFADAATWHSTAECVVGQEPTGSNGPR